MSAKDTIRIQPAPGFILPGIPKTGADVERSLAIEWIDNGLAMRVEPSKPVARAKETK